MSLHQVLRAESKGSSSGLYRQGGHQQFKDNSKNATTFSLFSTCQQKAFGITYSAGVSRFSLLDIHDGCPTSASIYWGLFVAFSDTSNFYFVGECLWSVQLFFFLFSILEESL